MNAKNRTFESQHTPQGGIKACLVSLSVVFNRWKRALGLAVITLFSISLLSGCGFHLRGYDQPQQAQFKSIKLSGLNQVTQEVRLALRDQFEARGVKVVPSLAGAELDVQLLRTYSHSSKTSYTGTGDVASVLITLKQGFRVEDVATEKVLVTSEAIAYRDHQIDNAALLATNRELQEIKQQMANEVVSQIVAQINRRLEAKQASIK